MNPHDISGYQLNQPRIDWEDVAWTSALILLACWLAYDYIERLV